MFDQAVFTVRLECLVKIGVAPATGPRVGLEWQTMSEIVDDAWLWRSQPAGAPRQDVRVPSVFPIQVRSAPQVGEWIIHVSDGTKPREQTEIRR